MIHILYTYYLYIYVYVCMYVCMYITYIYIYIVNKFAEKYKSILTSNEYDFVTKRCHKI